MKMTLLSTVAVGSVIAASSAFAADLPSRKSVPTLASKSIWQGAYAGINAGYGVNNINNYYNGTGFYPIDNITYGIFNSSADYIAGGAAGAQLGYNHVFANHIMAGTEIDLDWTDIYNNANPIQTQSSSIYSAPIQNAYFANSYIRTGLDWIGTARVRVGYDLGRFLPYVTGGLAYGALSHAYAVDYVSQANWSFDRGSGTSVSLGWAAGAGAEYMVADNWSVKGEYLFTSLSGISTPTQAAEGNNTQGTTFLASYTDYTGSIAVHQVRVGLNYHPNWWGAAPIVGDSGIASSSSLSDALPSHKSAPLLTSTSLWKGIYAGINAGYGVNNITNYASSTGFSPTVNATDANFSSNVGYIGGGLAGAQLGYNYVFANRVMTGAEIDFDWADIYNNATPSQAHSFTISSGQNAEPIYSNYYNRSGLDWIGTARVRVGYDLGRFLPYITGGLAYGGLSQLRNDNVFEKSMFSFTQGNSSTVSVGWVAGAGAEYMVADNWSVKGEYLFTSLSGISTPTQKVNTTKLQGDTYVSSGIENTGSFSAHQIRMGLNYHPSWWGTTPTITPSSFAPPSLFLADIPSQKASTIVSSTSSWGGLFVGINGGYGVNNITNYNNESAFNSTANLVTATQQSSVDYIGGGVAGAQVGYNYVFANRIMTGAEIDFDWADIYNNVNPSQNRYFSLGSTPYAGYSNNFNRLGLDWIGTARARVGYDLGRFLPYITGGFAYGGLTQSKNSNYGFVDTSSFTEGNSSTVSVGWAAGAGAEYMVADNWSVKGEYLFSSIGGISTPYQQVIASNTYGNYYISSGTDTTGSFGVHQVRAGLNYHPNWWGAAPVISAY